MSALFRECRCFLDIDLRCCFNCLLKWLVRLSVWMSLISHWILSVFLLCVIVPREQSKSININGRCGDMMGQFRKSMKRDVAKCWHWCWVHSHYSLLFTVIHCCARLVCPFSNWLNDDPFESLHLILSIWYYQLLPLQAHNIQWCNVQQWKVQRWNIQW